MTYRDLENWISSFTEEQKNMNVSIYDTEEQEYHAPIPKSPLAFIDEDDVLDKGHPVINI